MYHIKNQEEISPSTPIAQSSFPLPSLKNKVPSGEKKVKHRRGTTAEATFIAKSTWPSSPVSSSIIKGSLIWGCVGAGSDTNAILMRDDEKTGNPWCKQSARPMNECKASKYLNSSRQRTLTVLPARR